jgi:hypothetical protein
MDGKGRIIKEGKISNTKEVLQKFLNSTRDGKAVGVLKQEELVCDV